MGSASIARFLGRVDGRVGVGQSGTGVTACRADLVIARRGGSVAGTILAKLAAPPAHSVAFVVRTPVGDMVQPATVMVNQTPIDSAVMDYYVRGPAQLGVAEAVDGAAASRKLPPNRLDDLNLLVVVALSADLALEPVNWPYEERIRLAARMSTIEALDVAMSGLNMAGVIAGAGRSAFGDAATGTP